MVQQTQHTPGPWRVGPISEAPNDVLRLEILADEMENRWGIAQVQWFKEDNTTVGPTQQTNARLIATAPKLLGASENLLNVMDKIDNFSRNGETMMNPEADLQEVVDDLREAIAKATQT